MPAASASNVSTSTTCTAVAPSTRRSRTIGTLAGLRDEGVIGHIGLSNVSTEQFAVATSLTDIAAVTAHYNVADRTNEPLLAAAEAAGAVFVAWQPVSLIPPRDEHTDVDGPEHFQRVLRPIARRHDATVAQISLAWLLHVSPAVLPIPGTTSIEHLRQNLAAQDIELASEEVDQITELARQG